MDLTYLFAFFLTAFLLFILRHAAPRIGLLDEAKGHKTHLVPTPMVGGIGIFLGFFFSLLLLDLPLSGMRPFFMACGLLVVIGVLDDIHELSSNARFVPQILAAIVMVYWGQVQLDSLGQLVSEDELTLGRFSVALTIFATVGVINAFNMIDGMDGLSGAVFLVAFGALLYICQINGLTHESAVITLVLLGVGAFLLFNVQLGIRKQASMFLGDAGAMFLGFVVAWYVIQLSQGKHSVMEPVTALWLVAVPLLDTVVVMFRRMLLGYSPLKADRTHIHHLLQHRGLSINQSLILLVAVSVAMACFGIWSESIGIPSHFMFFMFLAIFVIQLLVTTIYVKRHKLSIV